VEAEMGFVIVSKLPAIKAFINNKVMQSSETIPVFILSFSRMNLCIYVPVQLMMLLVSQITHSDG
jgi:hypothetical protein